MSNGTDSDLQELHEEPMALDELRMPGFHPAVRQRRPAPSPL